MPKLISRVAVPFFIPTRMHKDFICCASSLALNNISVCVCACVRVRVCVCVNFSHCNRYIVASHYGFILSFSNDCCCWASFHVLICHLYFFFGEMLSIQIFCPFLKNWFFFLLLSIESTGYKPFVRCVICIYFVTVCSLSFYSLNSVFLLFLVFMKSSLSALSLMDCAFDKVTKNLLLNPRSWGFCPVYL